jgi:hypothetical protein
MRAHATAFSFNLPARQPEGDVLGAETGLVVRAVVLLPPSRQFGLAALATVRDEQAGVRDD